MATTRETTTGADPGAPPGQDRPARRPPTRSGRDLGAYVPYAVAIAVGTVILSLLGVIIWTTFQEGLPGTEQALTLGNYQRVLDSSVTLPAVRNSLVVGLGTLAVNLFFAVPAAYLVHRTDLPLKQLFTLLMLAGVVIPSFVKSIGWILLLSPQIGLLNELLRLVVPGEDGPLSIYNLAGIVFVQGLLLTPLMFFAIVGTVRAVNPELEEAAELSGAGRRTILRRVSLPLIKPAVAAAAIYNFMTAIAIYDIQALLGGPGRIYTLSMLIFDSVHINVGLPRYGVAGVYGLVLMAPTLIALYLYQRILRDARKWMVITGRGYKSKLLALGRWKPAALGFMFLFFTLSLLLPLLTIVWTSFGSRIRPPSVSALRAVNLDAYREVIAALEGGVLLNSVYLMLTVGLAVTAISLCFSWSVVKSRFPGRRVLDTVSMLPHAAPNIAFAFVLAFISLALPVPIPLYGTVTVIVAAHVIAYVGFGTRTLNSALTQVHSELEEAGQAAGGSFAHVLRRITLPLIAPSVFYTFVWVSLLSLREVSMALLLQRSGNTVIATQVWNYWVSTRPSEAAALGTLLVVATTTIFALVIRLARRYGVVGV